MPHTPTSAMQVADELLALTRLACALNNVYAFSAYLLAEFGKVC